MIAFVRGPVSAVFADSAVVEVGGVGMLVMCTPGTLAGLRVGEEATLATSMVVREDSLTLFGFADYDERGVSSCCRPPAASAPSSPRRCSPCTAPTSCAGPSPPRTSPRCAPCPASAARARSGSCSSSRTGSARRRGSGARPGQRRRLGRRRLARPGAGRPARPRLVGREAEAAVDAVAPLADEAVADGRAAAGRRAAARRPAIAVEGVSADGPRSTTATWDAAWSTADADGDERAVEAALRPKTLDEVIGQERVREQLGLVLEAARDRGRSARPRAAVRPARARQDHDGDDHRRRDGRAAAGHQRAGHPARRRPGGDPVRARRGRRAVPRRDPPDVAAGRGDALPRDGGLPGRRGRRQGAGRDRDPAGDPAVHPGRRDHPRRPAARAAARPVRLHRPPGVLRSRRAAADRRPLGPAARRRGRRPTAPPRSRRGRAARRASPTGCCGGSATSPRSAPTASSPRRWPTTRWRCSRSTSWASTGSTGRCSTRCAAGSAAGPVGLSTLAVAVGEERETVEEVAEPFLVRSGYLARTPRGRVATPAAWAHLGLAVPPGGGLADQASLFDDR